MVQQDYIPIGTMAKLNGTTVVTLRHYDRLGLLKPQYVDEATGYRYYSIQQNARLDMIEYMKELGMSLKEIASILESGDITLIETMLAKKNEQIHSQIRELKLRHDAVERTIASIERYRKSPMTGTIALEYIDRRYIYSKPCSQNFYEGDISSFEKVLIDFRHGLIEDEIPQFHTYNIGTSIKRNDFSAGKLIAKDIFIFADHLLSSLGFEMKVVESGMYACIYTDSYDNEIEYAHRLLEFCHEHNYVMAGDYICEILTEFTVFDDTQRGMFLRLQVPLDFSSKLV